MTSLIAIVSSGKGTWQQVSSLIKNKKWTKVYLICNQFAYENFNIDANLALKLRIDEDNPQNNIKALSTFFKKEIKDFEVAINLISGSGMEHMAILSAILKSGLGIRLVYVQNNQVKEFELLDEKYIPQEIFDEF